MDTKLGMTMNYTKDCECGCGTKIWHRDDHGRIRRAIKQHNTINILS